MNLAVWLAIGYVVLVVLLVLGFRALKRWDRDGETDEQ